MAAVTAAELPAPIAAALSAQAHAAVAALCHAACESGISIYLVGGLVRDYLLLETAPAAERSTDLDLAVEGEAAPLAAGLRAAQWTLHDRFGTATLELADGSRIDLARTRSEQYPVPAALPLVSAAAIEADLARRDFTINAAAFGLTGPHRGLLLDPHGGARDAERLVLRVLHDGSFRDDPTRLLRLCRYAARIHGRPERRTARLARTETAGLANLSAARFGAAWRALLHDATAPEALQRARRLRLPQARLAGWQLSAQTAAVLAGARADGPTRCWAAVGLTCSDAAVVERLPAAAALQRGERAALASGAVLRAAKRRIGRARSAADAAAALQIAPTVVLEVAAELWSGAAGRRVSEFLQRRGDVRSPLSGAELAALGVPEGPAVGAWLRRLERAAWNEELGSSADERIAAAEQWVRSSLSNSGRQA